MIVRVLIRLIAGAAWFAAASAGAFPTRSLLEIRRTDVVVQEWDMSCGAAALATVLTYQLGDPLPEKKVALGMLRRASPLRVQYRGGFSLLDLKRFAESRGFQADGYAGLSLDDLRRLAPVIVPVQIHGYPHFIVFRGTVGERVVLADPAFGNRTLTIAKFERAWNGGLGFVVRAADGSAMPNRMRPRRSSIVFVADTVAGSAPQPVTVAPLANHAMVDLPWPGVSGAELMAQGPETAALGADAEGGEPEPSVAPAVTSGPPQTAGVHPAPTTSPNDLAWSSNARGIVPETQALAERSLTDRVPLPVLQQTLTGLSSIPIRSRLPGLPLLESLRLGPPRPSRRRPRNGPRR